MFLPLGSPCKTSGTPRFVRGRGANTLSGSNTCVMHVLYTIGTDAMLMNYTMYRCNTRSASRSVFIIIHILRTETWELWRSTSQFLLTRGERHCSLQSSHNHSNGNQQPKKVISRGLEISLLIQRKFVIETSRVDVARDRERLLRAGIKKTFL